MVLANWTKGGEGSIVGEIANPLTRESTKPPGLIETCGNSVCAAVDRQRVDALLILNGEHADRAQIDGFFRDVGHVGPRIRFDATSIGR